MVGPRQVDQSVHGWCNYVCRQRATCCWPVVQQTGSFVVVKTVWFQGPLYVFEVEALVCVERVPKVNIQNGLLVFAFDTVITLVI